MPTPQLSAGCRAAALVAAALVMTTAGVEASAQNRPLRVSAGRDLLFGPLIPGMSTTIQPTDPVRSGRFDITGNKSSSVDITFTLPASMSGPSGAALPLFFGPTTAAFSNSASVTDVTLFDPRVRFLGTLSNDGALSTNGRGTVFVGGTAAPTGGQRAGTYTGVITITVAYTSL